MTTDPEWERYARKFPRFPGVDACANLLRRGKVRGAGVDFLCDQLQQHATDHVDELIQAIEKERDDRVRALLTTALVHANAPEALPLFVALLNGDHEETWPHAARGLRRLDIEAARRALWLARRRTFRDEEQRRRYLAILENVP